MRIVPSVGCSSPAIRRSMVLLPRARGTDEHEKLAVGDGQIEPIDGREAAGIGLAEVFEGDVRHGGYGFRDCRR